MPSRIWLPSSLAAPVNGAEMPNRTSLLVTPRMLGVLSFAPPTDATRAGIPPAGGAPAVTVDALEAGGAPLGGCGATVAIETPGAGDAPLVDWGPVAESKTRRRVPLPSAADWSMQSEHRRASPLVLLGLANQASTYALSWSCQSQTICVMWFHQRSTSRLRLLSLPQ